MRLELIKFGHVLRVCGIGGEGCEREWDWGLGKCPSEKPIHHGTQLKS